MLTLNISLAVLLSAAVLLSEKKLQVEANCNSNTGIYGCGPNKYCCKKYPWQINVCRSGGCVGEACLVNSYCGGPGECCTPDNVCTKNISLCHECYSNSDCGNNKYCCKQQYSYQKHVCGYGGCAGQPCHSDSYCGGPGECCNSTNYCTKPPCHECSFNSHCDNEMYCCKQRYSWQRRVCGDGDCIGQPCRSDSDCGGPGECCNSTNYCTKSSCTQCSPDLYCGYNKYCCKQMYFWQANLCVSCGCVGQSCSLDSDCGGPGECCNSSNYCTKSPCDECSSNSDCGYNKYCCKQRYSWQTNVCGYGGCVGQSCSSKNDCGGQDECCNTTNYCTTSGCTECSSNSDCGYNKHCCKQWNPNQSPVCGDGCVGHPCVSHSDCGSNEYCADFAVCMRRLETTMATYECISDSDCGRPPGPDECCRSNRCTTSGCWITLTSVAIISVVGSVIFTIVVTLGVVAWCHRRQRRRLANNSASHTPSQRVGSRQETGPAAVIAPQNAQTFQTNRTQFESPPPYAPSAPPVHYNEGQDFPLQQFQFPPQYAPDNNFQR